MRHLHDTPQKTVRWTPQMIRVCLDCIEKEKGTTSLFIANRSQAFHYVHKQLKKVTSAQDYKLMTIGRINSRIKHYLDASKRQKIGRQDIYQQGLSCLDLTTLPQGTYTEVEIEAIEAGSSYPNCVMLNNKKRKAEEVMDSEHEASTEEDAVGVDLAHDHQISPRDGSEIPIHVTEAPSKEQFVTKSDLPQLVNHITKQYLLKFAIKLDEDSIDIGIQQSTPRHRSKRAKDRVLTKMSARSPVQQSKNCYLSCANSVHPIFKVFETRCSRDYDTDADSAPQSPVPRCDQ